MISRKTEQVIREKLEASIIDLTTSGVLGISAGVYTDSANLALATYMYEFDTPITTSVHTGDFSVVATSAAVTLYQTISFINTGGINDFFTVPSSSGNFVFNLAKSEIVSQSEQRVELLWTGTMVKSSVSKATVVKVVITPPATIGDPRILSLQVLSLPTLVPIPILISDQADVKPPMPYILVECGEAENLITPSSGIFKTTATICFKTHAKYTDGNLKTSPTYREQVIDLIDQFAYNNTAAVLSTVANYNCFGWEQKELITEVDNDQKSFTYYFNYDVTCMALDN